MNDYRVCLVHTAAFIRITNTLTKQICALTPVWVHFQIPTAFACPCTPGVPGQLLSPLSRVSLTHQSVRVYSQNGERSGYDHIVVPNLVFKRAQVHHTVGARSESTPAGGAHCTAKRSLQTSDAVIVYHRRHTASSNLTHN